MPWVAIPESFGDDPKLTKLGFKAFKALVAMWCYSNRLETDGIVPREPFEALYGADTIAALARSGFVTHDELDIGLEGFLAHNLAREVREHNRVEAKKRKSAWKERRRNGVPNDVQNTSRNEATQEQRPRPRPRPEQIPDKIRSPDSEREARDAPGSPPPSAPSPDLVPESRIRKRERAPKAPKEPKPKRQNHPNYQACQDAIDQAYKRATGGVGPDWTNSRERQAVHALCPAWSAAEVEARANRFWVQKMPRFLWDGRVTIPSVMDFRSNFGRLAIAAASIPSDNLPTDDYYGVHPAWRSNGSH